jgi:hypothetical protein
MPVVDAAAQAIAVMFPKGVHQALVLVTIDVALGKMRFHVQLVAHEEGGDLSTPETTPELLRAVTTMIAEDTSDGNGRWSKLTLRLTKTERETCVEVDVR